MGTRQAEREKIKIFHLDFWKFHPEWTACLAVSVDDDFRNLSFGLHNRMAWILILIEIGTLATLGLKVVPFLQKSQ